MTRGPSGWSIEYCAWKIYNFARRNGPDNDAYRWNGLGQPGNRFLRRAPESIERMNIDLIGPSYPFRGGISYYTTLLFSHLKKKHPTNFYCFKRQYPRFAFPGKTDREESRFVLRDEDSRPVLDALNPWSWVKLALQIIRDRPTLTIFPWWVIYWAPPFLTIITLAKKFSPTKIVFLCHNVVEHEAHFFKSYVSKIVLRRGDYFIVHSTQEKENLRRLIGMKEIAVVLPPLYDALHAAPIPKNLARQKLGILEEKVILFFGIVREYKGLRYLIEALPAVLERFKVRLLIAGEFWEDKKKYLQLIRQRKIEKQVSLIDRYIPNEEIPFYFYASDLAVFPYTSVTGSGALQLAKGFHIPAVVTNIGSFLEVVTDKKTGFHVSPGKPAEIAAAVIDFFEKYDAKKMSRDIQADNQRFSWERLIGAIENFVPGQGR
jgi:glycosyltransferase involved in cell wall biosynthesis